MRQSTEPKHYEKNPTICLVDWCDRRSTRANMCYGHYRRQQRGTDMNKPWRTDQLNDDSCAIQWCDRNAEARGLCEGHRRRQRTGIDMDKPWRYNKSGEGLDATGYVIVFNRDENGRKTRGYRMKQRIVMEDILGRALTDNENVHHINGVRGDNRPENLELWVTSQPSGQRPADLVLWAKEILSIYEAGPSDIR